MSNFCRPLCRFETPRAVVIGYLEGLPLDLPRGGDRLGLDEEGPRVDQLHTLESLSSCIQVLTLNHLGVTVPRQLQDGLRDRGGVGR